MKTALLFLITLAVATGPAWALRCHVCDSATDCKKPQACQASARYCQTVTRVEPLSGNLVEKTCEDTCTPSSSQQAQVSSGALHIQCCQADLCNAAPAHTLFSSATLGLALALGLLALMVPSL